MIPFPGFEVFSGVKLLPHWLNAGLSFNKFIKDIQGSQIEAFPNEELSEREYRTSWKHLIMSDSPPLLS
jgi:hypothetical protein